MVDGVFTEHSPTWSQFMGMIKDKKLDVMLNIVKTKERSRYLAYTDSYHGNPLVIVARDDGGMSRSLLKLKGGPW